MPDLDEVETVARTVIYPRFADAIADGFHVSGIADFQPPDACDDAKTGVPVAKFVKPGGEIRSLANFYHL